MRKEMTMMTMMLMMTMTSRLLMQAAVLQGLRSFVVFVVMATRVSAIDVCRDN